MSHDFGSDDQLPFILTYIPICARRRAHAAQRLAARTPRASLVPRVCAPFDARRSTPQLARPMSRRKHVEAITLACDPVPAATRPRQRRAAIQRQSRQWRSGAGKGGGGLSGGDGGGGDGGGGDGGGRDGGGRDDLSDRRGKSEIEAVVAPAHSRPCKQGRTQRQAPRHRRRRGAANNGDTPQERRLHRHYLALRCVPCHNARNCSAARRRGSQPDGRTSRDVRRGRR